MEHRADPKPVRTGYLVRCRLATKDRTLRVAKADSEVLEQGDTGPPKGRYPTTGR